MEQRKRRKKSGGEASVFHNDAFFPIDNHQPYPYHGSNTHPQHQHQPPTTASSNASGRGQQQPDSATAVGASGGTAVSVGVPQYGGMTTSTQRRVTLHMGETLTVQATQGGQDYPYHLARSHSLYLHPGETILVSGPPMYNIQAAPYHAAGTLTTTTSSGATDGSVGGGSASRGGNSGGRAMVDDSPGNSIGGASSSNMASREMNPVEIDRLCQKGRARKSKRMTFFNSPDGIALRLNVPNHIRLQCPGAQQWCVLCGQADSDKKRSGHRTSYRCETCGDVPLCIRIHPGLSTSCWHEFHSKQVLTKRTRSPPTEQKKKHKQPQSSSKSARSKARQEQEQEQKQQENKLSPEQQPQKTQKHSNEASPEQSSGSSSYATPLDRHSSSQERHQQLQQQLRHDESLEPIHHEPLPHQQHQRHQQQQHLPQQISPNHFGGASRTVQQQQLEQSLNDAALLFYSPDTMTPEATPLSNVPTLDDPHLSLSAQQQHFQNHHHDITTSTEAVAAGLSPSGITTPVHQQQLHDMPAPSPIASGGGSSTTRRRRKHSFDESEGESSHGPHGPGRASF